MTPAETRAVLAALTAEGAEARAVGGAVRNALIGSGEAMSTSRPRRRRATSRRAEAAGLHGGPTGIEHGTVTVVAGNMPFEVTTLRRDVETVGRHAVVPSPPTGARTPRGATSP